MSNFKQLVNVHQHSDSSLDGASTIDQLVKRTVELGASAFAITEHGNINSAMDVYHKCKKAKIDPILGIELYVESPFKEVIEAQLYKKHHNPSATEEEKEKIKKKVEKAVKEAYVHLTVHFKDEWAYNYFCKLTPEMEKRALVRWGERKPICTLEEVRGASGHITVCSSCLVGIVQKWLLPNKELDGSFSNRPDLAEQMYCAIREIAGPDSFFVEVFPHQITHDWKKPERDKETNRIIAPGMFIPQGCNNIARDGDIQKIANQFVVEMARKYKDPITISLDAHYALPKQKIIQDAKLGNGQEVWKFYNSYHIYTSQEAAEELKATLGVSDRDIEEWIDNSYRFASLFKDFKLTTSSDRWILQPLQADWMSQLKKSIDKYGRMNWNDPVMVDRLKKEIKVLAHNGKINLISYYNTVEDIANFCRENDVLMNVRGSAGGSLLLYLLGVSAVNPLRHNLSFERMITEGRIKANTLPDVDMDFSDRDKVVDYLEKKYGDRFCSLSIDATIKLKSAIKDAERFMIGRVSQETETMCARLPQVPTGTNDIEFVFGYEDKTTKAHVKGLIETSSILKKFSEEKPEIWNAACEMMGIQDHKGTHACGVIIADKPVQEYMPIIVVQHSKVTGFSPKHLEAAGGVKYDVLGLNTLRDIQLCLANIKKRLGLKLDPWDLPWDARCATEFALGKTEAVFQFDTDTIRPLIKAGIKPKEILTRDQMMDVLAGFTSLGRPGTLDAPSEDGRTLAEVYIARCNGEPIQYIHQDLEPIMKETKGIQLYQEQTLQIYRDVGGFTFEEAEAVRRGIGKKEEKVLASSTGRLKEVCLGKGWSSEQIDLLIEQIMASARYSFNKSHATSYAYVAYACMYFKLNYPLDWWAACLTNADKGEVARKFWKHVSSFTTLPDINCLSEEYTVKDNKIISPITIINGLGEKAYTQLIKNAPYTNLDDFVKKNLSKRSVDSRSALSRPMTHKMIAAGLLDSLFEPNLLLKDKLTKFETSYSEVREEKPHPVPPEFGSLTKLGEYMIKKQLVNVYSDDLRPLMLPARGGRNSAKTWFLSDNTICLEGHELDYIKRQVDAGKYGADRVMSAVAYVIDEKAKPFQNKSKRATILYLDVNGTFFEEIFWPDWGSTEAPMGFRGQPVILTYNTYYSKTKGAVVMGLKQVTKMIREDEIEKYNEIR